MLSIIEKKNNKLSKDSVKHEILTPKSKEAVNGYLLITPALFLMLVLLLLPVLAVFTLSFTNWQLGAKQFQWIGFSNYLNLFKDRVFIRSSLNTLYYSMIVIPFSVVFGLGIALLIQADRSFQKFYRAVFFLPVMSTFIAMVIVWEYMLHPNFGLINSLLSRAGFPKIEFLRNEKIVLNTICGIGIWQQLGYNMILFMAGLSGISKELYQAAEVDGANNWWHRFTLVTWPQLGPVTLFVIVITAIRSFQVFESVHVLTMGGPNNASEVMIFTMYEEGFHFLRTGYASSIAVVFMIAVLIITIIKSNLIERRIHYK